MRGPDLPADDLYARLELPIDAAPEAIEIAWRALLKRHHPDVAGSDSLETAKRINVAHDWLSDPILRRRYDDARGTGPFRRRGRPSGSPAGARPARSAARPAARRPTWWWQVAAHDERPGDLGLDSPVVRAFLDRVERLSADELDRLDLADRPPIAFVASIRRFLADERVRVLVAIEAAVMERLPARAAGRPRIRDAVTSYGHHLVLAGFLADELTWPFRERVAERMSRGWEAAVDQPRYGPNTREVKAFIDRIGWLSAQARDTAVAATDHTGLGAVHWPRGTHPAEDESLRISVALAEADAAARVPDACHALAAVAGTLVLRRAYAPPEFSRLVAPLVDLGLIDAAVPAHRGAASGAQHPGQVAGSAHDPGENAGEQENERHPVEDGLADSNQEKGRAKNECEEPDLERSQPEDPVVRIDRASDRAPFNDRAKPSQHMRAGDEILDLGHREKGGQDEVSTAVG